MQDTSTYVVPLEIMLSTGELFWLIQCWICHRKEIVRTVNYFLVQLDKYMNFVDKHLVLNFVQFLIQRKRRGKQKIFSYPTGKSKIQTQYAS